ncbi:MAG: peptide ABC transporter substrate-binding protein [Candidatus Spechtbacterales bacterium]
MRKYGVVFLALAFIVTACSSSPEPSSSAGNQRHDVLLIPAGEPLTLDPHLVTDAGSHGYTGMLYAKLVRLEPAFYDKNGNLVAVGIDTTDEAMIKRYQSGELTASAIVVPDLAEEIPTPVVNGDGTVSYTFVIRENAKFANGRVVTARDMAYSLDRAADPRTRSSTAELYLGDIVGVLDMQRGRIINRVSPRQDEVFIDLTGVEVLDERTIRITTLADSVSPELFMMKMTYEVASVVDKVQTEGPARWTDRPNSTGPWVIVKKDVAEIVMEPNPNYFGHKPQIQRIVFYISGGSTYLRYENDELYFTGIGVADLDLLKQVRDRNSELSKQYFEMTEMSTSYIGFNTRTPPFDDPLVRQAFAMSVDKASIARDVLQDLAVPANGVLPPGMPGYRADYKGLEYNPAAARELLAQSKYAGNMPRVKITISGSGSAPSVVLQSIVQFWKSNLGVEVEIEQVDYATFLEELKKGTFQMYSLGWIADYPDPDNFFMKFESWRSSANNETRYSNDEVDDLIREARVEPDPQKRIQLYRQIEDIVVADAPWITLFHPKDSILIKPFVCGYYPTPMGISILRYVSFCDR